MSDNATKFITDTGNDVLLQQISETDRITLIGLIFETASGLRHNLSETVECEIGVGGQSFEIMLRLLRTPSHRLRMADLAAQTGLSPSGLSRAVDKLTQAGHLKREDCANDRRGAYATLTQLGIEHAEIALIKHKQDIDNLLCGVMRPQEEDKLVKLLTKIRDRVYPNAVMGADE